MIDYKALWQKNMQAIVVRYPELEEKLNNALPDMDIDVLESMHATTRIDLNACQFTNPVILMFFSLIPAQTLLNYIAHPHPNQEHIVIIENDISRLAYQCLHYDLTPALSHPRIDWIMGQDISEMPDIIQHYLLRSDIISKIACIDYVSGMHDDDEYYQELKPMVDKTIQGIFFQGVNEPLDSFHGFVNLCQQINESNTCMDANHLAGVFAGKPGILVGTGPSLESHYDRLREVQNDIVIVAADSALVPLLSHDIQPHFVCSMERDKIISAYYTHDYDVSNTIMLYNPFVHADVRALHQGPRMMMVSNSPILRWFYPDAALHYPGTSVSHMGLSILHHMGCGSIYLLGHDLAFDRLTGHTHADDNPRGNVNDVDDMDDKSIYLMGNNGEKIKSNLFWKSFLNFLVQQIQRYNINCINVIDQSAGASIQGASWMCPADFIPDVMGYLQKNDEPLVARLQDLISCADFVSIDLGLVEKTIFIANNYASELYVMMQRLMQMIAHDHPSTLMDDAKKLLNEYQVFLDTMQSDSSRFYDHLLNAFMQSNTFLLSCHTYKIYEDTDPIRRVNAQLDIAYEWCASAFFWTNQIVSVLSRYLDGSKMKNEN